MKIPPNSRIFARMKQTQRQKKVATVIQKDLAQMLQRAATGGGLKGTLISISKVYVTTDLSLAKVYVSIFPSKKAVALLADIEENHRKLRHELAQRTRHQLRRVPELKFYLDDSLDYIDSIEKALKEGKNPVKNPNLLGKRKKY